jgi:hypothetical protein
MVDERGGPICLLPAEYAGARGSAGSIGAGEFENSGPQPKAVGPSDRLSESAVDGPALPRTHARR